MDAPCTYASSPPLVPPAGEERESRGTSPSGAVCGRPPAAQAKKQTAGTAAAPQRAEKSPPRYADSSTAKGFWRYHPESNWGSGSCSPTPYRLAMVPEMERMTRLELATSTLARWRSTR